MKFALDKLDDCPDPKNDDEEMADEEGEDSDDDEEELFFRRQVHLSSLLSQLKREK